MLNVKPNIPTSEPAVYILKPNKEEENLSACLATDFGPNATISIGYNETEKMDFNASFVVVKNPESGTGEASYGVVHWAERDKSDCFVSYQNEHFHSEDSNDDVTTETCTVMEMDENFETDGRLNFLSFTVLGLRVIFLKGVAVNLLLTFRLWSS
uniref:T-cell receptor alpha chain constant domain-containing protein n=1 Tax=Sphenodon punctatus TaxID=8508 RepID=A0A8D0L492_SPHPU